MDTWIVIGSFHNEIDASVAKGQLESNGIPCHTRLNRLGDALLGAVGMQNGPTELLVRQEDKEKAEKTLQQ